MSDSDKRMKVFIENEAAVTPIRYLPFAISSLPFPPYPHVQQYADGVAATDRVLVLTQILGEGLGTALHMWQGQVGSVDP